MPYNKNLYPPNWNEISKEIRFTRANNQCECMGQCGKHDGRCPCLNYEDNPRTGGYVVLTVAHWPDSNPQNVSPDNLHAMCQQCHNAVDAPMRAKNRAKKKKQDQIDNGQLEIKLSLTEPG